MLLSLTCLLGCCLLLLCLRLGGQADCSPPLPATPRPRPRPHPHPQPPTRSPPRPEEQAGYGAVVIASPLLAVAGLFLCCTCCTLCCGALLEQAPRHTPLIRLDVASRHSLLISHLA